MDHWNWNYIHVCNNNNVSSHDPDKLVKVSFSPAFLLCFHVIPDIIINYYVTLCNFWPSCVPDHMFLWTKDLAVLEQPPSSRQSPITATRWLGLSGRWAGRFQTHLFRERKIDSSDPMCLRKMKMAMLLFV